MDRQQKNTASPPKITTFNRVHLTTTRIIFHLSLFTAFYIRLLIFGPFERI